MKDKKKILIVRLSALGDVAMTIPVIYSLARRYPDVEISVLTRPFFGSMFINAPANIRIIPADFKGEYRGLKGTVKLLKMLRKEHFDAVADFHNVMRSWIVDGFLRINGVKVAMLDKRRSERRRLLKGGTEHRYDFINRYEDVIAQLGYEVKCDFKTIFDEKLPAVPFDMAGPCVGIAPFARYYNKTYPPELMRQVVEKLDANGVRVFLFGGRGKEAAMLEDWAAGCSNVLSVAGKYSIETELAIMAHLRVMVSMDSANQHLASLTGIPVITVWGSTTPLCGFNPYRQPEQNGIVLDLDCQPCSIAGTVDCPHGHLNCLRGITPERIVKRTMEFLK